MRVCALIARGKGYARLLRLRGRPSRNSATQPCTTLSLRRHLITLPSRFLHFRLIILSHVLKFAGTCPRALRPRFWQDDPEILKVCGQ